MRQNGKKVLMFIDLRKNEIMKIFKKYEVFQDHESLLHAAEQKGMNFTKN